MTPEEKIARGRSAEALLANPLLEEALTGIKAGLLLALDVPPAESSPEMREGIYHMLQGLRKFREALTKYVRDGNFELKMIENAKQDAVRKAGTHVGGSGTA